MGYIPSKYQQAIYDYIKGPNGHLVVEAVAGGSKTTTAIESLRYVHPSKRVLFLAFNKSIADTLRARVPTSVKASTIHSQGYGIVKQLYDFEKVEEDKVYETIQELAKEGRWIIPKDERMAFFGRIRKIVDLMRLRLASTYDDAEDICNVYDIENLVGEASYAIQVFESVVSNHKKIDFTDLIYIPATHDFKTRGYDMIYVDEFQDCCRAQYVFIRKLLAPGGRLVMIGDRRQAIYGHLGCDAGLFDEALAEPDTISLPLSISYRCPAAVIRHAKKIVPEIEARDDAPEGKVVWHGSIKNVKDGDVVLCRTNFPTVQLCLNYLRQGKKAIVRGNDLGKSLVGFLKPYQDKGVDDMDDGLEKKRESMVRKLTKKYPDRDISERQEYKTLMEKIQIINILSDECELVSEVITKIEKIFSDDMSRGIIISTVHRFKGLEAENVFIVEPHLIPLPYDQPWQKEQERNVDYVARTRAIGKLEYIRDWSCFPKMMAKMLEAKRLRDAEGTADPQEAIIKVAEGDMSTMQTAAREVGATTLL
jgi:DNA helicase-2/ATP-dependent DNA helicase PcrA